MLKPQEIKELSQLSPWKGYLALFFDYLLLFSLFAIGIAFPKWWVIALLIPFIARTQLALAIIMHDGAHRRLHPQPKVSDFISQAFVAGPILFSSDSYKKNHLLHHKVPLQEEDPDLSLIAGYPIGKGSFFRKICRDLFGLSYFKFIHYFLYGQHKRAREVTKEKKNASKKKQSPLFLAATILIPNGLFFALFAYFQRPWLYFFLWLLPLMTWLQLFLRIRGIAEHSGYKPNNNQALCSRTVVNWWQTFFVAPHNVNYHIEHHLYVGIPFYHLPKAHKILKERKALPTQNTFDGYGKVLKELVIKSQ